MINIDRLSALRWLEAGACAIVLGIMISCASASRQPPVIILGSVEGDCPVPADVDTAAIRKAQRETPVDINLGDIKVRVVEQRTGVSISGAIVTVRNDTSPNLAPVIQGRSDARGIVEWRNLLPGVYWLKAESIGYLTVRGSILVRPNGRDSVDVKLPQSPIGCLQLTRW